MNKTAFKYTHDIVSMEEARIEARGMLQLTRFL